MRTTVAVALTILAAALAAALVVPRQFENHKTPAAVIAHETGEGYCALDDPAVRGDVVTLSEEMPGYCHAESAKDALGRKRGKGILGIIEQPCACGQPCKIIMLDAPQTQREKPTITLRQ